MRPRAPAIPPWPSEAEPPSWLGPWVVAGAGMLIYLSSLGNGFALDDVVILVDNPRVHGLSRAWELLLMPYWPGPDALDRGLYRPLTSVAFAAQWALGAGSPLPFHLTNVLLHGGVSALLFLLLDKFVGRGGAFAGGLLFALHPVHVEAVANVVGQAELWSALLVLAAANLYVRRGADGLSLPRGGTIALLYGIAMLFKEHAVVLPALLFVLDLGSGRLRHPSLRRQWIPLGVLLLGVAAQYLTLRWIVLGGSLSGRAAMDLPFLAEPRTRVLTALTVWPEYARLLVFPLDLSAVYDPGTLVARETMSGAVLLGALILITSLAATALPRGWPGWGLGFAWFFVAILPVSNLLVPVGTLLGERTLYLPSVAVGFWAGFASKAVLDRRSARARRVALAALAVVSTAFAWRVVTRTPAWQDNATLFQVTLRDHPENFRAHWFAALEAAAAGDTLRSAESWERARAIYGSNSGFLTQYAAFQRGRGELREASALIEEALRLRPSSASALLLGGLLDRDLGDRARARGRIESLNALGFEGVAAQLSDSLAAGPPSEPEDFP